MVKKYTLTLLLLISTICLFNSCEEDDYYDLGNLLFNRVWTETYINNDDLDVYHKVVFYANYTGNDYYEYYRGSQMVRREEIAFRWEWDMDYPNSIYIDYADGTYSYFDDLFIKGNRLYGIWDDVDVEFIER